VSKLQAFAEHVDRVHRSRIVDVIRRTNEVSKDPGRILSKPPQDRTIPNGQPSVTNVGAQYFWIDRIFIWENDESNFVCSIHTYRPGSLDTSFVSTDNINNPRNDERGLHAPRTLGACSPLGQRSFVRGENGDNKQFNEYIKEGPLTKYYEVPGTVWTPRVLKDGADSVGALGALNRVYVNIGTFSEEWLLHFNALVLAGSPLRQFRLPFPVRIPLTSQRPKRKRQPWRFSF